MLVLEERKPYLHSSKQAETAVRVKSKGMGVAAPATTKTKSEGRERRNGSSGAVQLSADRGGKGATKGLWPRARGSKREGERQVLNA